MKRLGKAPSERESIVRMRLVHATGREIAGNAGSSPVARLIALGGVFLCAGLSRRACEGHERLHGRFLPGGQRLPLDG